MENQTFTTGKSIVQSSQLFKDSRLATNFNSVNKTTSENPDDYVYIDKETWNEIEQKIKFMIDDLETLNQANKKLEESLQNARSEKNKLVFDHNTRIKNLEAGYEARIDALSKQTIDRSKLKQLSEDNRRLREELADVKAQNEDLTKLNDMLEENSEKDRKNWVEYQRMTDSKYKETLNSLLKEKEFLKSKMQSERQIITENTKSAYKAEKKISSSKMLVFETQNEFLETELAYYKKKVNDLESDKKFMESKIENYQNQLKIIMECVANLEQKFGIKESKIITDSQFETLKHSINFHV